MTVSSWDDLRSRATVFEDEAALVLNKPAGVAVMGERHGVDLADLAAASGATLYPAHRIDKATSGAILFAKELRFHGDLTRQFNQRQVGKVYLAVTRSSGLPAQGIIDLPLSVGRKNRVRVGANREEISFDERSRTWSVAPTATFQHAKTYPSRTEFVNVWNDSQHTLLAVTPATGRRHQIRVHLAWIGYPILGDPLFSPAAEPAPARMFLHSWHLSFHRAVPPADRIHAVAPPGADFWEPLRDRLPDDLDTRLRQSALPARPAARPAGSGARRRRSR